MYHILGFGQSARIRWHPCGGMVVLTVAPAQKCLKAGYELGECWDATPLGLTEHVTDSLTRAVLTEQAGEAGNKHVVGTWSSMAGRTMVCGQ